MTRGQKRFRDPSLPKRVVVHPELHKKLHHDAVEHGGTIQDRVHIILCQELDRPDLIPHAQHASTP